MKRENIIQKLCHLVDYWASKTRKYRMGIVTVGDFSSSTIEETAISKDSVEGRIYAYVFHQGSPLDGANSLIAKIF